MKPILFLLLCLTVGAQPLPLCWREAKPGPIERSHATKECAVDGFNFKIDYDYNGSACTIPATMPPGEPHYDATITVWMHHATMPDEQVGEPISGIYVEHGCFEDVPTNWVANALEAHWKKQAQFSILNVPFVIPSQAPANSNPHSQTNHTPPATISFILETNWTTLWSARTNQTDILHQAGAVTSNVFCVVTWKHLTLTNWLETNYLDAVPTRIIEQAMPAPVPQWGDRLTNITVPWIITNGPCYIFSNALNCGGKP